MIDIKEAPICQSCSLPMQQPNDFGTNADGGQNEEYCTYCFQNGQFTEPAITKDEMVNRVTDFMKETETGPEEAIRLSVERRIRNLRRWQETSV